MVMSSAICLPRMAITMSSLRISIEPREMKCSEVRTSPRWTSVSPGGAWVVLNFIDNALRNEVCAAVNQLIFQSTTHRWEACAVPLIRGNATDWIYTWGSRAKRLERPGSRWASVGWDGGTYRPVVLLGNLWGPGSGRYRLCTSTRAAIIFDPISRSLDRGNPEPSESISITSKW